MLIKRCSLHFQDAVCSFKGSLFDGFNVVPAQVQTLEVWQPVEQAKSWNPGDVIVVEQQSGKGNQISHA